MDRYNEIARRVATAEVVAVSFLFAKERPSDLFSATFFDIREKAKGLKETWEDKAKIDLEAELKSDLEGKGFLVPELKISLGKYRGSRFVTSAKFIVVVGTKAKADGLLTYLQQKYSPKLKLKSFDEETKEAEYNVR